MAQKRAAQQVDVGGRATVTSGSDRVAKMRFDFEMGDPSQLEPLLHIIRGIDSVYDVHRVVPGRGG